MPYPYDDRPDPDGRVFNDDPHSPSPGYAAERYPKTFLLYAFIVFVPGPLILVDIMFFNSFILCSALNFVFSVPFDRCR